MAWIESHSVLIEHRKVREAANLLGIEPVHFLGHLHCLWHKVIELREDGDITSWSVDDISYYARWKGDVNIFYDALKNRFIDEKNEKKLIHDWFDYAGKYLYAKYHQNNPKLLKQIKKMYQKKGYKIGYPKGSPKGSPKFYLPNQPNQPNQPSPQDFERFWEAYPKKKSKGQAEKAWQKISLSEQLLETILSVIEIAKTSEDWQKENGKYIPYPATWLNAKGWLDEYTPANKKPVEKSGKPPCRKCGSVTYTIRMGDLCLKCKEGN